MSAYSGIPSDDNTINKNNPNKYDIQKLIFKHIDTEMYRGGVSIICRWGKADFVIVSQQKFEEFASTDKWHTKSKCYLSYINDVNRIYLNQPLKFTESEAKEFEQCKEKYPEVFL